MFDTTNTESFKTADPRYRHLAIASGYRLYRTVVIDSEISKGIISGKPRPEALRWGNGTLGCDENKKSGNAIPVSDRQIDMSELSEGKGTMQDDKTADLGYFPEGNANMREVDVDKQKGGFQHKPKNPRNTITLIRTRVRLFTANHVTDLEQPWRTCDPEHIRKTEGHCVVKLS